MAFRVPLDRKHAHDLQYSPYFPTKLACATGQYYGLAGSGSLQVISFGESGKIQPQIQSFLWSDSLFSLSWSEKNEQVIIAGGGDGSLLVYDINNTKGPVKAVKAHSKELSALDWSQFRLTSHLFISASWDKSIKLWDGLSFQCVTDLPTAHNNLIYDVKSSPLINGLFLSVSADSSVRIWDMNSSQKPANGWIAHEAAEILTADWCKYDQSTIATGGTDGLIKLWDIRSTSKPTTILPGHQFAVRRVKFSPHHRSLLLSASYDFTVRSWDYLKHNHPVQTYNHHTEFVCGLDMNLHTENQVASAGWDESAVVWSL